jgi:hypothetical protein
LVGSPLDYLLVLEWRYFLSPEYFLSLPIDQVFVESLDCSLLSLLWFDC